MGLHHLTLMIILRHSKIANMVSESKREFKQMKTCWIGLACVPKSVIEEDFLEPIKLNFHEKLMLRKS